MSDKVMSRLNQIVALCCNQGVGVGMTRREICDGVGLKKSPYTIELIERCVIDGWLESEWMHGAALPTKLYYPSSTALAAFKGMQHAG